LNFGVLVLHITNCYGQHFTIGKIIHMISHSYLANNTFHMIKHDLNILKIPYILHSCDEANSILNMIYRHLKKNTFCPKTCLGKLHLKCNHNVSWTSIQWCYQYSHLLNDTWKKQQGYECWESLVHKTCLGCVLNVHLQEIPLCHR